MKDLLNLFDGEAVRNKRLAMAHISDMMHLLPPWSDEIVLLRIPSKLRNVGQNASLQRTHLTILTIDYRSLAKKFLGLSDLQHRSEGKRGARKLKGQKNPASWSESRARSIDLVWW